MPKNAIPLPELTDQQKEFIKTHWKMDLRELVCAVFGNPNLTLRNVEAKAIRKYLAELGLDGNPEVQIVPQTVVLSPEIIQFVENNYEQSSPLELVRSAYKDESLTLSSPEGRSVLVLLKKIAPHLYNRNEEPVDEIEYKPPRNLNEMIARVNKLVPNKAGIGAPLYQRPLNAQQEKNLNVLLSCVNTLRFIHQASQYLRRVDRDLFESSFLRHIHDNTDLTAPDVDQYIAYCASIVSSAQSDRTIQRLQTQADDEFETGGKVSMTLIERLNTLNDSLQNEKKRQEALYKTLNGARSARINDLTQASISMHPLVERWRTKEGRNRILKAAGLKRDALGKEYERLLNADAIRCEIYGIDESILR